VPPFERSNVVAVAGRSAISLRTASFAGPRVYDERRGDRGTPQAPKRQVCRGTELTSIADRLAVRFRAAQDAVLLVEHKQPDSGLVAIESAARSFAGQFVLFLWPVVQIIVAARGAASAGTVIGFTRDSAYWRPRQCTGFRSRGGSALRSFHRRRTSPNPAAAAEAGCDYDTKRRDRTAAITEHGGRGKVFRSNPR